jgi:hypothetical protein
MRYLKQLGLLAVAAAALMVFAASVSATTVTSPEGTTYTGAIKATSSNAKLSGSFVTVECSESTLNSQVEQHGAGITVEGHLNVEFKLCNYRSQSKPQGPLASMD